ncbi:MAG: hypothetical protein RBR09_13795 [Desulfobulbaceae bacterium]|nr:hypothetical protein [Lascolabacillus sp.]MDY0352320.1 hypothetical protein [Desulfobulbaceae bacterium]
MSNLRPLTEKRNFSSVPCTDEAGITSSVQIASGSKKSQVSPGVDKLKVSLWLDWKDNKFLSRLQNHKLSLQETTGRQSTSINFSSSPWSNSFVLHRTGTTKFSYRIITGDVTVLLSPRPGSSRMHNCQVEIGSVSCQVNAQGIYKKIINFLAGQGGQVIKEMVSEIHTAADLVGIHIKDTEFSDSSRWIKRANEFSYHEYRGSPTGISLGKGGIMLRIYDKIREMKVKKETSKQEFFSKKWGCDITKTPVTRVEFQFRRAVLKQFTVPVTSVAEVMKNLQALWGYCTQVWSKFCANPVDRKNNHQSLSKVSEYWALVQSAAFSRLKKIASREIPQKCVKNISALAQQFRGIAQTIAASCGVVDGNVDDVHYWSQRILKEELQLFYNRNSSEFMRRQQIRFNECYVSVL